MWERKSSKERREEEKNWRDKRNYKRRPAVVFEIFFDGHSTEHQIYSTNEITTD